MGYNVVTLFNARSRYTLAPEFVEPEIADDLRSISKDILGEDLEPHHCRYPHGKELPYLFCGNDVQDGSSYCSGHHAICWTPARLR